MADNVQNLSGRAALRRPVAQVTMAEIAERANVAESTVSRALAGSGLVSPKTRDRVVAIAEEMGYEVTAAARNMRRESTKTLELILPIDQSSGVDFRSHTIAALISAVTAEVAAIGYDLLVTTKAPWDEDRPGNSVTAGRADGMIILEQAHHRSELNTLFSQNYPVVVWGSHFEEDIYPTFGMDNAAASEMLTKHLLSQGKRSIAFVGETHLAANHQRYRGYGHALVDANLTVSEPISVPDLAAADILLGALDAQQVDPSAFDAYVCANDGIAYAMMSALRARGISVPENAAVVGFGEACEQSGELAGLTTIRQDVKQGGYELVRCLVDRINGKPIESRKLTPELVVRTSCGSCVS